VNNASVFSAQSAGRLAVVARIAAQVFVRYATALAHSRGCSSLTFADVCVVRGKGIRW
jgi:hypothetical protein